QDVLSEVIGLFPGKYVHIGGDEVDKTEWKRCPKCQARMKAEGLKDENELQSWFVRRVEAYLNGRDRSLIGWDEILEGGLAPRATVMSWRGTEGGITAAKAGHDVVMTPTSHCYFDYYQGNPVSEPLAIGGFLPLSKAYAFEPVPDVLSEDEAAHVIGGQANLWAEYVPAAGHAEYMLLPRLAALSEAVWSAKGARQWVDFSRRLDGLMAHYDTAGLNYARSAFQVRIESGAVAKRITAALETEIPGLDIRFTTDGTAPRASSKRYVKPLTFKKTTELRATAF
ncbi:MAG: family 20 glycosylhydrolase, partial [Acidobacteriota bacterium]